MNDANKIELLNGLFQTLCRSVAMYVQQARPWTPPGQTALLDAIGDLARDQTHYAAAVAQQLDVLGARPEGDTFPLDYTAINDLSVDYLLGAVRVGHDRDLARIETIAHELDRVPGLGELAEEIVGNARGHAEILAKCPLVSQDRRRN